MNNMMVPLGLRGTPCISNNNDFKFRMFQNELFVGSSYFNYGNWSCPRSQASLHLSRQPWHRCYYPPDMPTDFAARTPLPSSSTSRQTSLTARRPTQYFCCAPLPTRLAIHSRWNTAATIDTITWTTSSTFRLGRGQGGTMHQIANVSTLDALHRWRREDKPPSFGGTRILPIAPGPALRPAWKG